MIALGIDPLFLPLQQLLLPLVAGRPVAGIFDLVVEVLFFGLQSILLGSPLGTFENVASRLATRSQSRRCRNNNCVQ